MTSKPKTPPASTQLPITKPVTPAQRALLSEDAQRRLANITQSDRDRLSALQAMRLERERATAQHNCSEEKPMPTTTAPKSKNWLLGSKIPPGSDFTLDEMKRLGIPLTRANYLDKAWGGEVPNPYPAELEAELPPEIRKLPR